MGKVTIKKLPKEAPVFREALLILKSGRKGVGRGKAPAPARRTAPPDSLKLGTHCLICKQPRTMTREHLVAAALFTYPDAPQASLTCAACNGALSVCERELFNDPFVQQAKSALHPVSLRDGKRRGWIINEVIAYHGRKPGHQFLYGPDKEVVRVFAPEPCEAVWRSVGKTILIFAAFVVGNRALDPALDPLRDFVRQGGSASAAGLRRGPNPKVDRWDDYHELCVKKIDNRSFGIDVTLFARYSFSFTCNLPAPMPTPNARIFLVRIGVLQRGISIQGFDERGKKIRALRNWIDRPLELTARFLQKLGSE